ncbi:MAG: TolC family protein [Endomicrobiia bacterium]
MKKEYVLHIILLTIFTTTVKTFAEVKKLTLEDCLEIVLSKNQQILQAKSKLDQASYKKYESLSAYLPKLQGQARYTKLSQAQFQLPPSATALFGSSLSPAMTSDKIYTLNFTVTQLLFSSFKMYEFSRQAWINYEIAKQEYEKTKTDLTIKTKESFYRTLLTKNILDVARESLDISSESLQVSTFLYNEGRVSYFDLSNAKITFLNAKTSLLKIENGYKLAKESLQNLLNINEDIELFGKMEEIEKDLDYEKLKNNIMKLPDIQIILFQTKIMKSMTRNTVKEVLPTVALTGSYDWTVDEYTKSFDQWDDRYSWTVSLVWPIFNGGGTLSRFAQMKESVKQLELTKESLENVFELELKSLYLNYVQQKEMLKLNKESVELAKENLGVAKTYYSQGRISHLELLQSELNYSQSKINYYQTLSDYLINLSKLEKFNLK